MRFVALQIKIQVIKHDKEILQEQLSKLKTLEKELDNPSNEDPSSQSGKNYNKKNREYSKKKREYDRKEKEYRETTEEKVLIKCYRDDSTYWRLCRAMEKKQHGILSSYLIYKILGIFAESSVRGPAEEWGLDNSEAKRNIIRGDILFAIAQHEFDFAHLNELGSLADLLVVCDELEEFSRYGRELLSRRYYETTAETSISFKPEEDIKPGEDIEIEMVYVSQHKEREGFLDFFRRKAERLCSLYSLRPSPEDEADRGKGSEDCCTITNIEMRVEWEEPQEKNNSKKKVAKKKTKKPLEKYWLTFVKDTDIIKGKLPECAVSDKKKYKVPKNGYAEGNYELKSYDDKLRVIRRDKTGDDKFKKEIPLKEWLGKKDKNE